MSRRPGVPREATKPIPRPLAHQLVKFTQFIQLPDDPEDCWTWTAAKTRGGYGAFRIGDGVFRAPRVSLAWLGGQDVPPDQVILHACDNPTCVSPLHLRTGTQKDNVHEMLDRGRANRPAGEAHPKAKLTASDVITIRALRTVGCTLADLSKQYGVSEGAIHAIVTRRTWKKVA